ncbi:MAG: tail fiber domain-containing protein [Candidatus Bathyarchaeota archaeon]|nr:tail fiber domain-containing protein [Candidatus Termiticorpusculum sp.]
MSTTPQYFNGRVILRANPAPYMTPSDIVKSMWWFQNGMWKPQKFSNHGESWITITDNTKTPPDDANLNLFMIRSNPTGETLFAIDNGLVVQKDIGAGGFVSANQGALYLGSGLHNQVDIPKIILNNADMSRLGGGGKLNVPGVPSGTIFPSNAEKGQLYIRTDSVSGNPANTLFSYNGAGAWIPLGPTSKYAGNFDTLYIRQSLVINNVLSDETPGNLDVGNVSIHGHLGVGNTVTTSLHPATANLALGNPLNIWEGIVVKTAYLNALSPISAPYGNGDHINVSGTLKSNVNGVGYRSYYGGGGGGNNGGVCLDKYGNACFIGGNSSNYWSVLTGVDGSPILSVGYSNWVSVLSLVASSGGTRAVYAMSNGVFTPNSSSERYKENIQDIENSSWVYDLKPVSFEWKDKERKQTDGLQIGLIAENVHALCPSLAWVDEQGNPEGIHYEKLAVPMLAELKKLRAEVNELKAEIASYKKENTA